MNDGANHGVGAQRALDTILGGKDAPTEEECENRETVRARVLAAPGPLGKVRPMDYGQAADCIAKAFLLTIEDRPELLQVDDLWKPMCEKFPGFDEWLGGASGFMVGWANNCVRWLMRVPPVPNPALVTIG